MIFHTLLIKMIEITNIYKHLKFKIMKEYLYFLVAVLLGIVIITMTIYLFGFESATVGAFSFIFGKLLYNDVFKK